MADGLADGPEPLIPADHAKVVLLNTAITTNTPTITALEGSRVNCGRSDAASARSEDVTNRSRSPGCQSMEPDLAVGV